MKKGRMILLYILLLACMAGAGATLAYFTDTERAVNSFTVGSLNVVQTEPEWNPEQDGKNVYPGEVLFKDPTVTNLSSANANPAFVRMVVRLLDEQGNLIQDKARADMIKTMLRYDKEHGGPGEQITQAKSGGYSLSEIQAFPSYNETDFELQTGLCRDAVLIYDYKSSKTRTFEHNVKLTNVFIGGTSATLFNTVLVPSEWTKTEMQKLGNFRIEVTTYAIQAMGFANRQQAIDSMGVDFTGTLA